MTVTVATWPSTWKAAEASADRLHGADDIERGADVGPGHRGHAVAGAAARRPRPRRPHRRRARRRRRWRRSGRRAGGRHGPSPNESPIRHRHRPGRPAAAAAAEAAAAEAAGARGAGAAGRCDPHGGRRHGAVRCRRTEGADAVADGQAVAAAVWVALTVVELAVVILSVSVFGLVAFLVVLLFDLVVNWPGLTLMPDTVMVEPLTLVTLPEAMASEANALRKLDEPPPLKLGRVPPSPPAPAPEHHRTAGTAAPRATEAATAGAPTEAAPGCARCTIPTSWPR